MDAGRRQDDRVTPDHLGRPVLLRPFTAVMLAPSRVGSPAWLRAFARPYREVSTRLETWRRDGLIVVDTAPALYLHEYTVDGLTARGIVGLLDLRHRAEEGDPPGVYPHEDVHPDQVLDLADRMGEMSMNPAPILLAHRGPAPLRALCRRIASQTPDWSYLDRQSHQQRIWAIREPGDLALVDAQLAQAQLLIADGHHRYGAYLEMARRNPDPAHQHGLAMIIDDLDTPLFLGAIHRLLEQVDITELSRAATARGATTTEFPDRDSALQHLADRQLVVTDGRTWLGITMPRGEELAAVQWLHVSLLPALPDAAPRSLSHHHSVEDTLAALHHVAGLAVLLPAPDLQHIERVALAGHVLPEKATSFQPKPSMGVLMRAIHGD